MNNLVKHVPRNEIGRDFVVGDIHGCFDVLRMHLQAVNFDESKDRLFSVGDIVDRGTQSEESIDWIDKPWFHAVRGNHEQMAIDVSKNEWPTDNYAVNGGQWFLKLPESRQKLFAEIFETLPVIIEIDHAIGKVGIVHADVPCQNWQIFSSAIGPESDQIAEVQTNLIQKAIWSRSRFQRQDTSKIENIERVYVGHTPLKEWSILGNIYFIDTGCVFANKLTLMEIK